MCAGQVHACGEVSPSTVHFRRKLNAVFSHVTYLASYLVTDRFIHVRKNAVIQGNPYGDGLWHSSDHDLTVTLFMSGTSVTLASVPSNVSYVNDCVQTKTICTD